MSSNPMSAHGEGRNIADALAEHLPKAAVIAEYEPQLGGEVLQVAVPKWFELKEVDTEKLLPAPRRTTGIAKFDQATSFIAYVNRHASANTIVWCRFNPQTYSLSFTAVFDEHGNGSPGWRSHRAQYVPDTSAEWKVWKAQDRSAMGQLAFAEFIETNSKDIYGEAGYPSDLQMLAMATDLELRSDKAIKSVVRIQGGGTRLDYVDDESAQTLEQMKAFDRFQLALPVFWGGEAYRLIARLKYRQQGAKVNFTYELQRPDTVHEDAAKSLIGQVADGISGEGIKVPLMMGAFD